MEESKTVIVKFRASGDPSAQSRKIRELVGKNVVTALQLFPGESEEELASLFEVVLEKSASVDKAVSSLQEDPQIEYAHPPAPRHPA